MKTQTNYAYRRKRSNIIASNLTVNPGESAIEAAVRSSQIKQQVDSIYSSKKFIQQIQKFFDSPFKDDKRFGVQYLAGLTRDRIDECEEIINSLFYDKIFNMMLNTKDDYIRHTAFQILSNIVSSTKQREKLANQHYFSRVFEKIQTFNE